MKKGVVGGTETLTRWADSSVGDDEQEVGRRGGHRK